MAKPSELEALKRMCKKMAAGKKVEDVELSKLSSPFSQRFERALEAVKGKRVKKYVFKPSNRVAWIVVGKERDYIIMPEVDFCTCNDFFFRVMDRQIHLCYHLVAQRIAETLGIHDYYEATDDLYEALMKDWKKATV